MRDPIRDPQVDDVVQGVWRNPKVHIGPPALVTVEARIGNLVATSSNGDNQIVWRKLCDFCVEDGWIAEYRVVHMSEND